MLVLGVSGGPDLVYTDSQVGRAIGIVHDTAAALLDDGKVVAAIEEERLNRIKHTSKGPVSAIKFCLDAYGVRLQDIDKLAIAGDEVALNRALSFRDFQLRHVAPFPDARGLLHELLQTGLEDDIEDHKLCFVHHHLAHAMSAHAQSGFHKSLVFTTDGGGDNISGMLLNANGTSLDLLQTLNIPNSLGMFYLQVTRYLGYEMHDEYKIMGLAPYGDPARYRKLFDTFYQLLPNGGHTIRMNLPSDLAGVAPLRKRGDPIEQVHKDIAAALQEALEKIVFHILSHYRRLTGMTKLCLAGGVAHNCTMTGKLLYSGLFEDMFVHPASHDAGLAVGAALCQFSNGEQKTSRPVSRLEHVYWGTNIGNQETIHKTLHRWTDLIDIEHVDDITQRSAQLLADGAVIGWVQGRSEFGPRALGNRSIIADPRPANNKVIINQMVKKRESYRPFAPSILEEYVHEYFDIPREIKWLPFMNFVVKVRADKREVLGATTHVDGTARVQTVSRQTNPMFWEVINAFLERTGVPVLLNTSFNNNREPIVDSVRDAVVSFLTTQLNYLVVGNYLVSKRNVDYHGYLNLIPTLPLYATLVRTRKYLSRTEMAIGHEISNTYNRLHNAPISSAALDLLMMADGRKTLADLLDDQGVNDAESVKRLCEELQELWALRVISLDPR